MAINYSIHSIRNYSISKHSKPEWPSPKLNYTITLPKELTSKIFNPPAAPKKTAPLLSPTIGAGAAVNNDLSSLFRLVTTTTYSFLGKESPAAMTALGFTNIFSVILGGLGFKTALQEIETAEKTTDTAGRVLGYLRATRESFKVAGSTAFFSSRVLAVSDLAASSRAFTPAAGILGRIGTYFSNAGTAITSIATGIRLFELYSFRSQIDALMNRTGLTEKERLGQGFAFLKSFTTISGEEREEIRKAYPEANSQELDKKANLLLMKKGELFKRLAGGDCWQMICEKGVDEAQVVLDAVQDASRKKTFLSSVVLGLSMVGIILASAWLIFTTPELAALTPLIGIAASLGWLVNDSYTWINELKSASSGAFDKAWVIFSAILAVAAVVVTSLLSGEWIAMAVAAAFGILWLSVDASGYFTSHKVTA